MEQFSSKKNTSGSPESDRSVNRRTALKLGLGALAGSGLAAAGFMGHEIAESIHESEKKLIEQNNELIKSEIWDGLTERVYTNATEPVQDKFNQYLGVLVPGPRGLTPAKDTGQVAKNYREIVRQKYVSRSAEPGSVLAGVFGFEHSRFQTAQLAFQQSTVLPDTLKALLPYIPFEESGYRDDQVSPVGAAGPWQFMPETAEQYGLDSTQRDNFVQATDAAVAHFEHIYTTLSTDPNYLALASQYGLSQDFLNLSVVNAYNSGESHMINALALMNNSLLSPDGQSLTDPRAESYLKDGDVGAFQYMTQVYPAEYKTYQKPFPEFSDTYYITQSPAYPYKVLSFAMLDNPDFQQPVDVPKPSFRPDESEVVAP